MGLTDSDRPFCKFTTATLPSGGVATTLLENPVGYAISGLEYS